MPFPQPISHTAFLTMTTPSPTLTQSAHKILTTALPSEKASLTKLAGISLTPSTIGESLSPPSFPSRPPLPKIVPMTKMPTTKTANVPANVFHLLTIAHVELNAIDLCFDTFLRFPQPECQEEWAEDWLSIASDEARHYTLLSERLQQLGYSYGDLPAHSQIWDSAKASENSVIQRLCLGQLVAEARGLDAAPRLAERLVGLGDNISARIVRTIAEEEIRHVEIGVKWFVRFCEREGKDPIKEFQTIALGMANPGAFVPPFNTERRLLAGMEEDWYLPVAEEMKRLRRAEHEREKMS